MDWIAQFPFRLGTTSYILPDDILPNVRWLAGQVQDVELVLFELDDGYSNLPNAEVVDELSKLAVQHDLSYTVHLPLDLRLGAAGELQHESLIKAQKVIACTSPLNPYAYVLHLDGREVHSGVSAAEMSRWQIQAVQALEIVAGWAGGEGLLAVENLEGYPLDFLDTVLERIGVSCCIDVGHLWLEHYDPLPFLVRWLDRARVIHLHGYSERDHRSLSFVPAEELDAVLAMLCGSYRGVVTVEVFGEEDFRQSLATLWTWINKACSGDKSEGE